jgi:hypothetical protein
MGSKRFIEVRFNETFCTVYWFYIASRASFITCTCKQKEVMPRIASNPMTLPGVQGYQSHSLQSTVLSAKVAGMYNVSFFIECLVSNARPLLFFRLDDISVLINCQKGAWICIKECRLTIRKRLKNISNAS